MSARRKLDAQGSGFPSLATKVAKRNSRRISLSSTSSFSPGIQVYRDGQDLLPLVAHALPPTQGASQRDSFSTLAQSGARCGARTGSGGSGVGAGGVGREGSEVD